MEIKFVPYHSIDKAKWDNCISSSVNGLIYAQAFYLDAIADNWDALVLNDYEAVMPLVWRKKWGIKYLYQPSFIQQLGIFFTKETNDETMEDFIEKASEAFEYIDITINYSNTHLFLPADIIVEERANYIVSLNRSYEVLYDQYHPNFTKSLRRIKKFNLKYEADSDIDNVMNLYQALYSKRLESVSEKDIQGFTIICNKLQTEDNLVIRKVYSTDNILLAAALLLKDNKRLYNIISCITDEGKKHEANYFLYDQLIQEFCNQDLVLDLEGSDRKGIANFYQKFNPKNEPYLHIKRNNLHPILKLFKR